MLSPLQIPSFGLLPFNVDVSTPGDGPAVLTPEVYDPKSKSVSNQKFMHDFAMHWNCQIMRGLAQFTDHS